MNSWHRPTSRAVHGLLLLLCLTAAPARAQTVRDSVAQLADSLNRERLPGAALLDKAAEGTLKGADDTRILVAVRALAQRLRQSRTLLGADARAEEYLATSSALYAGVPPNAIASLVATQRKRNHTQSLSVPLLVIAELASARVPTDIALSSVAELMARGAIDADLRAFRVAVDRDIRRGATPRDAATAGVQRTLRGLDRDP